MSYEINVNQIIEVNQKEYRFVEHPFAPGMLYGQEGRQATVYKLVNIHDANDQIALKVFKTSFRKPAMVSLSTNLKAYASFKGLSVSDRIVLTPQNNLSLLQELPNEFIYSVAMPWIEGPTWFDIIQTRNKLSEAQSLEAASNLADVLSRMEQAGVAHCDISGPNLILPLLNGGDGVELIDVEGFYAPGFPRPAVLVGASPGYGQRTAQGDIWGPEADRFSGSMLLAEILCWSSPQIRSEASQESYFEPEELQSDCRRLESFSAVLKNRWGEHISSLFLRAWNAQELQECPIFGEWVVALSNIAIQIHSRKDDVVQTTSPQLIDEIEIRVTTLLKMALQFEKQGKFEEALQLYKEALQISTTNSNYVEEISRKIKELENKPNSTQKESASQFSDHVVAPILTNQQPINDTRGKFPQKSSSLRHILLKSLRILWIGLLVGIAALLLLASFNSPEGFIFSFSAAMASITQIIVLRRSMKGKGFWIAYSIIGGLGVGSTVFWWNSIPLAIIPLLFGIGFIVGMLQASLVGIRKAKSFMLWAGATGITWLVGGLVFYWAASNFSQLHRVVIAFLIIIIIGLAIKPLLGRIKLNEAKE